MASIISFCLVGASVATFVYYRLSVRASSVVTPSFALFSSSDQYYSHIRKSVSFDGVDIRIISVESGDNFWKIARRHNVNIDTLIAANPYWESLNARKNDKVVVPSLKGVLHFVQDYGQIGNIRAIYEADEKDIIVQRLPLLYKYWYKLADRSEPIAIFIRNARPSSAMMTGSLASQFALREQFRSPLGGRYSSFFGKRNDPINGTPRFHAGVDIASPYGTIVGAASDGVVTDSGWMGGYGNAVMIDHKNGFRTLYGHLSVIGVSAGRKVKAGQYIGRVGSTGWSTGPHLHFTMWQNGVYINPMKVLW
ncbi:MAG TPA: M23 family metallopeptidase [Spirochaetota bacterium]|nr:M23 family metallopeptidase [Spirochaetota bacterium]